MEMRPAFYDSISYQKKQSSLTRRSWQKGVYSNRLKRTKINCARNGCCKNFIARPSDPKKYCSLSCAAIVNNEKRSGGPPISQKQLIALYKSGFSAAEIAEKLDISVNKVIYWLRKFQIPRRSLSEALYLKQNPNGDPFSIRKNLTPKERELLGLGLGIYWGEGNKVSKGRISVSNSDYRVISKFVEFLIKVCQIETSKLRFNLQTFNDVDPEKSLEYWCKELNISKVKFNKVIIIPPLGKGNYRNKSKYGVCSVNFCNIKLKKWIISQLE